MEGLLQKYQHLKIQLEEITSATNNFDYQNNFIGGGGFGKVYKGEVSHYKGRSMAAIKRLDSRHGQGEAEFLKEVDTLSRYKHENIISLLGFCYQGVLLNGRKTWFSLNKRGERCEMISIDECLGSESKWPISKHNSRCYSRRFPVGAYNMKEGKFKARVQTQFLSPGIRYTVNLVFKLYSGMNDRKCAPISLKYKIEGETESSTAYLAYGREDGWLMCELYQFTCVHKTVDLRILFEGFDFYDSIEVDGIEFRPLEKVEHKEDQNQLISNSVGNWEDQLPTDYEDLMIRSRNRLQWKTKEEAYSIMRKGFTIYNMSVVNIWFYLDKDGKKCHMLSARVALKNCGTKLPLPGSRFGEATMHDNSTIYLDYSVLSELISSETIYAIYLVYTLSEDQYGFEAPMIVQKKNNHGYIYLLGYQIPVIEPKDEQWTHNPPSWLIDTCLPQQRNDGWMEVQLLEFRSPVTPKRIDMNFSLESIYRRERRDFMGLIIEGIDIRPIKGNMQKATTF